MDGTVKVTYIGHATVLIEAGGKAILTDPNFAKRILCFFKRHRDLRYDPKKLPELSAVLISHTHVDHLDFESLNYISSNVPIILPEGSGVKVSKFLPNPVIELSHWADHTIGGEIKIQAMPALHSSCGLIPYHFKSANGYVIEIGGKTIFFAGDTAYGPHFKDIGGTYRIDCALLPIGSYNPAFMMKRWHMDPVDALQAFADLGASLMIPIHWGTFRFSLENPDEPKEWLEKLTQERSLDDKVRVMSGGSSMEV